MRYLTKLTNFALAALILAGIVGVAPAQAAPATADGPNLLVNPGFEGPYVKQCCHTEPNYFPNTPIDEVQVANGWRGWWLEPRYPDFPPVCTGCTSWHRPEWRASGAPFTNRYRSGANAQKYFTFYSVHKAGMYQQVSGLTSGQRIRFSVYMHAWSTNGGSLTSTVQDNDMGMKVGIDPTGGTDPFSSRVIWSNPFNTWDVWALYSVEANAQGSTVTVFTHSQARWGLEHNDIYIDDASLVVTDGSSSAPAPTTTTAPGATNAPAATAAPTLAPAPTATPVPQFTTYVIQRGDSLYAIARKFGTTAAILQQVNGIANISRIFAGQVLKIPNPGGSAPAPAPTTAPGAPAPTAVVISPNQGQATTYVIVRGDRLVNVARKFNTTLAAILAVNPGLDANRIFAGQTINIPATQATGSYTVQVGDTLAKIAARYGTTVAAIQAINRINNINTIFVGQVLLIP